MHMYNVPASLTRCPIVRPPTRHYSLTVPRLLRVSYQATGTFIKLSPFVPPHQALPHRTTSSSSHASYHLVRHAIKVSHAVKLPHVIKLSSTLALHARQVSCTIKPCVALKLLSSGKSTASSPHVRSALHVSQIPQPVSSSYATRILSLICMVKVSSTRKPFKLSFPSSFSDPTTRIKLLRNKDPELDLVRPRSRIHSRAFGFFSIKGEPSTLN
ncbi:hypothetical protein B0H12DRAFT_1087918 [Mycena haematopus]|nr:hypothetical protein B0H12DRAFT_1087918 [Mycena haematopus]